jgi:hypothetical protein
VRIVYCKPCLFCGVASEIEVPDNVADKAQQFVAKPYLFGFVQNEFPTLSRDEREALLTGAHQKCWDTLTDDLPCERLWLCVLPNGHDGDCSFEQRTGTLPDGGVS